MVHGLSASSSQLHLHLPLHHLLHRSQCRRTLCFLCCNANWEIGIIHCSCGRNIKSMWSPTEFDQNNRDVTSIPGYVIKKNSSRGVKHGPSERQKMYHQAKQLLKKARQKKHGRHPTIFSRRYASESYRNSLYDIGWRDHLLMLYV